MVSTRPTKQLVSEEPQGGQSCAAITEKSALDSVSFDLMEKIVDDDNLISPLQAKIDDMGANETCSPGNKYFHKNLRMVLE